MQTIDTTISTKDGFPLAVTQFIPDTPKANLVIAAGLGIPRQFYKHLAEYAANRKYLVTTFDYRGINDSQSNQFQGREHKFSYWGQKDLDAILEYLKNQKHLPLLYLAHSAGGQVLGMTSHCKDVVAATFIASVLTDPKNYPKLIDRIGLKFLWWILLPLLSLFGDKVHASKLGLSTVDVPTGVIREWSAWGRTKRYLFEPKFGYDLSHYSSFMAPLKVMAIADDGFATPASCFDLASEYPNAQVEKQVFKAANYAIKKMGHFGYFRKSSQICWAELIDWYDDKL